jgi:transcription elongation factor GreA
MAKVSYVTEEGLLRLKDELDQLKRVERPSISRQIAEARDKGDLSENAEYDAAKEAQGLLEMRIAKLEDVVANSRIIDESKIDANRVAILNKITLLNTKTKAQMTYVLVSDSEANLKEGKLSINTPIAKALLGKEVGDEVEVKVPSGVLTLKVMNITR